MEEEIPEPESERPRYLLPYGCKDLIDAIRLREQEAQMPKLADPSPAKPPVPTAYAPPELPLFVSMPDPVTVRDLAVALRLKTFVIIKALMAMDIFANPNAKLDFATASRVCARYGVTDVRMS